MSGAGIRVTHDGSNESMFGHAEIRRSKSVRRSIQAKWIKRTEKQRAFRAEQRRANLEHLQRQQRAANKVAALIASQSPSLLDTAAA